MACPYRQVVLEPRASIPVVVRASKRSKFLSILVVAIVTTLYNRYPGSNRRQRTGLVAVAAYTSRQRYLFVVVRLATGQESYAVQQEEETKATKVQKETQKATVAVTGRI
jgi:hypothetical protein